jgi:hypothetical protein
VYIYQVQLEICSFLSGKPPFLDLDKVYTPYSGPDIELLPRERHPLYVGLGIYAYAFYHYTPLSSFWRAFVRVVY